MPSALHVHSHHSILDALDRPEELASRARSAGLRAVALTDHGTLAGAVRFEAAFSGPDVQPIFGLEAYVPGNTRYRHLTLLCETETGWRNLVRLSSDAWTLHYDQKPIITWDALQERAEGLLCLSGCASGPVARAIRPGAQTTPRAEMERLADLFPGRLWGELQNHGLDVDPEITAAVTDAAAHVGVPLVATGDTHYASPLHQAVHDACLAAYGRRAYDGSGYHLLDADEMAARFPSEAVRETDAIAERCSGFQTLSRVTGFEDRPEDAARLEAMVEEATGELDFFRIMKELDMIRDLGFCRFILFVSDVCAEANRRGIRRGPGRGSAAGSVVCHALGITGVDPFAWNLSFDRFLNEGRRGTPPDIDIDVDSERRGELTAWLTEQHGALPVASYHALRWKGARAKGGAALTDEMKKAGLLHWTPEDEAADQDRSRHAGFLVTRGRHPGGLVLDPEGLIPRSTSPHDRQPMSEWDAECVGKLGAVKLDLLGSREVSILVRCEAGTDERPDHEEAVKAFAAPDFIFQWDTGAGRSALRTARPKTPEDLVQLSAINRPGPLKTGMLDRWVSAREGRVHDFPHPEIERLTRDTFGCVVFQEQVGAIAGAIAGFDAVQSDRLRQAIGKKKASVMAAARAEFLAGCESKGNGAQAAAVWTWIEAFAGYGFNRSHAVCYTTLALSNAWYRLRHPALFFAGVLNLSQRTEDVARVARLVKVLPPCVDRSEWDAAAEDGAVRLGFKQIARFPREAVARVVAGRPYPDAAKVQEVLGSGARLEGAAAGVRDALYDLLSAAGAVPGVEPGPTEQRDTIGVALNVPLEVARWEDLEAAGVRPARTPAAPWLDGGAVVMPDGVRMSVDAYLAGWESRAAEADAEAVRAQPAARPVWRDRWAMKREESHEEGRRAGSD